MNAIRKLARSFKRLPRVIMQPGKYFSEEQEIWLDGIIVVFLLFIATLLQKLAWREIPGETPALGQAAVSAGLNTLMAWTGFFAIYYFIMVIAKKKTDLPDLLGAAGVAGLPVVILTFLSAVSWWVGALFGLDGVMQTWIVIQNIIAWVGLTLGWPGWMAYFIIRHKLGLPGRWPMILPIILLTGLFAAWMLTIL